MSTEVGSAYISLIPSAAGFSSKISKEINGPTTKAAAAAGKKSGGVFSKGFIAPIAVGMVALKGIKVFGGFIDDARESAKIGALTKQVIKSTGGAANLTAKQVGNLATSISNKTGVDDEAIQSGQNLLLTFTNLKNGAGKSNKIFDQTTSIMTDMSVALGTDTKSAALQLGKALNDPIKGVGALSRVGVSFTAQQKDQIKALVKSGDTMGAQKVILKELGKEFGGAAAAASTPMDKLKVTASNLGEALGAKLIPFVDKGAAGISALVASFTSGKASGTGFAGFMSTLGATLKNEIVPALSSMASFVKRNSSVLIPLAAAVGTLVAGLKVYAAVVKIAAAVQTAFNFVLSANPIGLVAIAVAALVAGLVVAYRRSETFRTVIDSGFKVVGKAASVMWTVLKASFRFITEAFLTTTGIIINGAAKMFGWVPGIGGKLKAAAAKFNDFAATVRDKLSGAEQLGRDFSAGLAKGIIAGSAAPVAAAVGVANKVTAGYAAAQKSHSPSKVAIGLGEFFSHGIAIGIKSGGKKAIDAVKELVGKVAAKASELKQAARDMASGVADSVKGVVDVSAIGAAITTTGANGVESTRTPSIKETLGNFASQAGAFATALAAMAKKGLAPSLIAAVAAAGPASGLTAAQALASATTADVKSVNASMSEIAKAGQRSGQAVVSTSPLDLRGKREEATLAALLRLEKAYSAGGVLETKIKGTDIVASYDRTKKILKRGV